MILPSYNFSKKSLSIYIHYPFCKRLCPYCDFRKMLYSRTEEKKYLELLEKEFNSFKEFFSEFFIDTIYVGGGSPSLAEKDFFLILEKFNQKIKTSGNFEFTIELNPEDINSFLIEKLRIPGNINRLSIGIQSFDAKSRKFLGREFPFKEFRKNFDILNKYFRNISFDILYGLPIEFEKKNIDSLKIISEFNVKHVSAYILTLYEGTPLAQKYKKTHILGEKNIRESYQNICTVLKENKFNHYEISNWSKPSHESRHNLNYWLFHNYLGLGPSASSRFHYLHWKNPLNLHDYEKDISDRKFSDNEILDDKKLCFERLFLLFRLRKNININWLLEKTRIEKRVLEEFLEEMSEKGLIKKELNSFSLTESGLLLSEEVFLRVFII